MRRYLQAVWIIHLFDTAFNKDLEYMTRKLIDEYELWGLKLNATKTKYMAIGDTSRDLKLEDRKRIISHVSENIYLGVRMTRDGNHEPEIIDRINKGRAAISKLNSILWDRDVTPGAYLGLGRLGSCLGR